LYDNAIRDYDRALEIKPDDPDVYYYLACIYSMKNDKSRSLSLLGRAIKLGFKETDMIKDDPDFNNIKETNEFKKIVGD
jgi:tetratricopeptide (TPR) repeat protein